MKSTLLIAFCLLSGMASGQAYFKAGKSNRYYFGVNAGIAANSWSSRTSGLKLFSPHGTKLVDGSSKLKAKTNSELVEIETIFPIGRFRLGFGIGFEFFSFLSLDVQAHDGYVTHGFPEYFKTDKFYAQFEMPIMSNDQETFEWFASGRLGTYAFSMVKSTSMFGASRWGSSIFAGLKSGVDVMFLERFSTGLSGFFEYKYFNNSKKEAPEYVRHHILSYGLMAHFRVSFR